MKFEKWLKRKYPNHHEQILKQYSKMGVVRLEDYLKNMRYNVGILADNIGKNKVGDLVLWKRYKEYGEEWNGLYDVPTGWTGQYEITYRFAKKSGMIYDTSYQLICKPII